MDDGLLVPEAFGEGWILVVYVLYDELILLFAAV